MVAAVPAPPFATGSSARTGNRREMIRMPASPKTDTALADTDASVTTDTGTTYVEAKGAETDLPPFEGGDAEDTDDTAAEVDAVALSKELNKKVRQARLDYSAVVADAKVT